MQELPVGTILSFDATTLANLAIQLFNVAIVMAVLIKVLYNPVRKFMKDREERIKSDIEAAEADRKAAEQEKLAYQEKTAQLDSEREDILKRVHAGALEKSDKVIADAQQRAGQILRQAREQAQLERRQGQEKMREQIIDLSAMIAGTYVDLSLAEEDRHALVDKAFNDLGEGA